MTRYSTEPENPVKSCKARGAYLRVHFKHCHSVAQAVKGMLLPKAIRFLEDVLEHKQAVPINRFNRGIGRHAQAKLRGVSGDKVGWPEKATKFFLGLLRNCESNAEAKGLDINTLKVKHAQANRAPNTRRRTYRAHGRIGPYQTNPAHIELICVEEAAAVEKADDKPRRHLNRKQVAIRRLRVGGGVTKAQ